MTYKKTETSWEKASQWYHDIVGEEGHYYHQHVIFPLLKSLLKTKKQDQSLLDLGCGQGAFSDQLEDNFTYDGVDAAPTLIKLARKTYKTSPRKDFHLADICEPFEIKKSFTHATFVLSFQNLERPLEALKNAKKHLKQGGMLILVLNHPCFRVPRQSSWGIDEEKKIQYRRVDSYMSSNKVPIEMRPGTKEKVTTYSFHHSLTEIFSLLATSGFTVSNLIESTSDKNSTGKNGKMENRSRKEIPLFLTLVAKSL